jgi:hypothetical protein
MPDTVASPTMTVLKTRSKSCCCPIGLGCLGWEYRAGSPGLFRGSLPVIVGGTASFLSAARAPPETLTPRPRCARRPLDRKSPARRAPRTTRFPDGHFPPLHSGPRPRKHLPYPGGGSRSRYHAGPGALRASGRYGRN